MGDSSQDAMEEMEEMEETGEMGASDGPEPVPGAEADCEAEGACADGSLCDIYECGGRPARYNHFGCARVPCEADGDCPAGEACFALAFDRSCEPSSTVCFEEGGACVCEATPDCEGVLDAHCLPTEFYPPQDYCDVAARGCGELGAWSDALSRAAEHHAEAALGQALADCATAVDVAIEACG